MKRLFLWGWLLVGRLFVLGMCIWGDDSDLWVGIAGAMQKWAVIVRGFFGDMGGEEGRRWGTGGICERVDWGVVLREHGW